MPDLSSHTGGAPHVRPSKHSILRYTIGTEGLSGSSNLIRCEQVGDLIMCVQGNAIKTFTKVSGVLLMLLTT